MMVSTFRITGKELPETATEFAQSIFKYIVGIAEGGIIKMTFDDYGKIALATMTCNSGTGVRSIFTVLKKHGVIEKLGIAGTIGQRVGFESSYSKEYRKRVRLRNDFGITTEQFEQMKETQSGCCAICGKHQDVLTKTLCVDHCHSTGKIRGLLCNNCNSGIGFLKDNTTILKAAIKYLEDSISP